MISSRGVSSYCCSSVSHYQYSWVSCCARAQRRSKYCHSVWVFCLSLLKVHSSMREFDKFRELTRSLLPSQWPLDIGSCPIEAQVHCNQYQCRRYTVRNNFSTDTFRLNRLLFDLEGSVLDSIRLAAFGFVDFLFLSSGLPSQVSWQKATLWGSSMVRCQSSIHRTSTCTTLGCCFSLILGQYCSLDDHGFPA